MTQYGKLRKKPLKNELGLKKMDEMTENTYEGHIFLQCWA